MTFKGRGTYNGKTYVVFERGKPDWGTYLKRQDDLDYWGKFEPGNSTGGTRFVLRNRKLYFFFTRGYGTFDLADPYGNILARTEFSSQHYGKPDSTCCDGLRKSLIRRSLQSLA